VTHLAVENLAVRYGGVTAVAGVSFEAERGQMIGIIGPNGAGKTSLIDGLTGFTASTGSVRVDGHEFGGLPAHRRAQSGLVRTWQSVELFEDLTVRENLTVAMGAKGARVVLASLAGRHTADDSRVDVVLDQLELTRLADHRPSELSNGQRKLVGVARAIITDPTVVCLDEPAAGLDSHESIQLGVRLRHVADRGRAVLLVDHDMGLVLGICDRVVVMQFGEKIAEGTPTEIRNDDRVVEAYLGTKVVR
jgi:branched-chain amino acid transport system ATP-binding protein